jgi:hypothetical protein
MRESLPGDRRGLHGAGGGFVDVIARTCEAASGIRATEQAIAELRLTKDTLIDCWPDLPLDGLYLVEHR